MMKNKVMMTAILSCLAVLPACRDYKGSLSVTETITLQRGSKRITIPARSYAAKLTIKDKDTIALKLDGMGDSFKFQLRNQNLKQVQSGDRIRVNAGESGQSVGFDALYLADIRDSGMMRRVDSCSLTERIYSCQGPWGGPAREVRDYCELEADSYGINRLVCDSDFDNYRPGPGNRGPGRRHGPDRGDRIDRSCVLVSEAQIAGLRRVDYFQRTTNETVDLTLLSADGRNVGNTKMFNSFNELIDARRDQCSLN
ncbi:MAG: hypothetical protein COT73_09385 [Bdellovibrio sp. CG10_big_fil_rev_8_21_14_0_10_47_8]|nr:MAG: hypothetical protein COT73_09385 [Bdellovibrio sp. CG10_big_fil_rev_8_21_14_0_10_47_8]